MPDYHLAIDIGASSGRHVLGHVEDGRMVLEELSRFDNKQLRSAGHDCWDVEMLWESILAGLEACRDAGKVPSTIGIDTWGVDFVLLDAEGRLVGDAVAYRDERTQGIPERVDEQLEPSSLYHSCGIQRQAFNTLYQLIALKGEHPELSPGELATTVKIQKAMAILQFKVEAQTIDEYPSFGLSDRKLLHTINRERGTVAIDGVEYAITDPVFPTVDWSDPYALSADEEALMQQLVAAFTGCARLQRHMQVLIEKGSLYKICGDFLVFHACVPLNADGTLKEVTLFGQTCKGRALFDLVDSYVRSAFTADDAAGRKRGADLLWYLWLGQGSPFFAKSKMATFEIYLVADKAARKEVKNPFYTLCGDERVVAGIFEDFGMDPSRSRIVCGHVPVKVKDGEDPVKCAGRVIDIDGGMSKPYQRTTGIAGFTLVSSGRGLALYAHRPFAGRAAALMTDVDLTSDVHVLE